MGKWGKLEKFEWFDPWKEVEKTYYPDHTECCGKKFYADRIVFKNGKVKKLKNRKKQLIEEILFDGRFVIVPDYTYKRNFVIDTKTNQTVGNYKKYLRVVEVRRNISKIEQFPISLWTVKEAMNLKPKDVATWFAGDNYITKHAVSVRFPSEKSIEIYMVDDKNNIEGSFKYYFLRGWALQAFEDGSIDTPLGRIKPKNNPKRVYVNEYWIEVHYDNEKVVFLNLKTGEVIVEEPLYPGYSFPIKRSKAKIEDYFVLAR